MESFILKKIKNKKTLAPDSTVEYLQDGDKRA